MLPGLILFFGSFAAFSAGSSTAGWVLFVLVYGWWWKTMIRQGDRAKAEGKLGGLGLSGPYRKGDR